MRLTNWLLVVGTIFVAGALSAHTNKNSDNELPVRPSTSGALSTRFGCLYQYQNLLSPKHSMIGDGVDIISIDGGTYRIFDRRAIDSGTLKIYTDNEEAVSADIFEQNLSSGDTVGISLSHTAGFYNLSGKHYRLGTPDAIRRSSGWKEFPNLKTKEASYDLDLEKIETTFAERAPRMKDIFKQVNPEALNSETKSTNALRSRRILKEFVERCQDVSKLKVAMERIKADFKL